MLNLSPVLNVMCAAAQKAARGLKRDFGELEHLQVSRKGLGDFVSAADTRTEAILYETLAQARPDYGFVLEERGIVEGTDKTHRWLIDPLDGTKNFLHAIPYFAISIGLERDNQLVAGVVYNPISDELFYAERNHGAFLNNQRLRVSQRNDPQDAIFACGLPRARLSKTTLLKDINQFAAHGVALRRMGAAALDLAGVAAGRFDGFWDEGLSSWDMAAGAVIVAEAGGLVSGRSGGQDFLTTGKIVAGNDAMHRFLLEHLQT